MVVTTLNTLCLRGRPTGGLETCHILKAKAKVTLEPLIFTEAVIFVVCVRKTTLNRSDFEFLSLLSRILWEGER